MKNTFQRRKEPNGDCLRSCVCSILEIPLGECPDFTLLAGQMMMPDHYAIELLQQFLGKLGMVYIEIALPENMPWNPIPQTLCILLGETKNGIKHAIVGRCEGADFIPVFNPWPEAEFGDGVAAVGFILPKDPANYMRLGKAMEKIEQLSDGYEYGEIPGMPRSCLKLSAIHDTAKEALGKQINGVSLT